MAKIVDARNKSCPQPVVLTTQALKEADEVITIVSSQTACQNVSRLAESQGCRLSVEEKEDGIYLTLVKKAGQVDVPPSNGSGIVIFIGSDILGRGENEALGNLLMESFLNTLGALNTRPESIIFMNNGVKLVVEGSPVLGELEQLEKQGVEILACGTCLSRLGLAEKNAVGQVSNMYTLADTMLKAGKLVSI